VSTEDFQKRLAKRWRSLAYDATGYVFNSRPAAPRVKAQVSSDDVRKALDDARKAEAVLDAQLDGGYSPS
jgi:hypothetical protein